VRTQQTAISEKGPVLCKADLALQKFSAKKGTHSEGTHTAFRKNPPKGTLAAWRSYRYPTVKKHSTQTSPTPEDSWMPLSADDADDDPYTDLPMVPAATYSGHDIKNIIEAPLAKAAQHKADQARLRKAVGLLVKGNLPRVQAWLDRVAIEDPGKAIELTLRLMKFTVPELRAVEVDMTMTNTDKDARKMTLGELQDLIEEKMTGERIIDGEVVDG